MGKDGQMFLKADMLQKFLVGPTSKKQTKKKHRRKGSIKCLFHCNLFTEPSFALQTTQTTYILHTQAYYDPKFHVDFKNVIFSLGGGR